MKTRDRCRLIVLFSAHDEASTRILPIKAHNLATPLQMARGRRARGRESTAAPAWLSCRCVYHFDSCDERQSDKAQAHNSIRTTLLARASRFSKAARLRGKKRGSFTGSLSMRLSADELDQALARAKKYSHGQRSYPNTVEEVASNLLPQACPIIHDSQNELVSRAVFISHGILYETRPVFSDRPTGLLTLVTVFSHNRQEPRQRHESSHQFRTPGERGLRNQRAS
jgi:hypothetical protein